MHFAPHPTGIMSRAVTRWLSAVGLNARTLNRLDACGQTNNAYVHVQMLGVWQEHQREHVRTINTAETELQDNRLVVKAI